MIEIKKVETPSQLRMFIDLPHQLFLHDPNYVPELYVSMKSLLDKKKHPFHKHSKVEYFLATKNNIPVGRIAAIRNNNHNSFNNCTDAFFGFFDSVNDAAVSSLLMETVEKWAKNEGLSNLVGPVNFSTNETCGLLVDGFEYPPAVMMSYNSRYYEQLLKKSGFSKKTDLFAYLVESKTISEKSLFLLQTLEERLKHKDIIIRQLNAHDFDKEIEGIKEIYNKAWNRNFGFVPMTDDEFRYLANDLKLVYDPELCFIAEHKQKMIGFALALPDINMALIKVKNGRLLPFGILKLLYYKRKINSLRVLTLGVIEGYRKLGIESCFYAHIIQTGRKKGYQQAEASWILENNTLMNQALQKLHCKIYKTYRIFEKSL